MQIKNTIKFLVTTRRGKSKTIVDKSVLACEHHPYMSAGVSAAINPEVPSQVLVIGLGGGGLSSFLYEYFPKVFFSRQY